MFKHIHCTSISFALYVHTLQMAQLLNFSVCCHSTVHVHVLIFAAVSTKLDIHMQNLVHTKLHVHVATDLFCPLIQFMTMT